MWDFLWNMHSIDMYTINILLKMFEYYLAFDIVIYVEF